MNRIFIILIIVIMAIVTALVVWAQIGQNEEQMNEKKDQPTAIIREEVPDGVVSATFAGGCFWCTESAFQETEGVTNAISGYAGGEEYNPTYEAVYTGKTGHRETLRVYYDPAIISYGGLLDIFWRTIDPTDSSGQFVDKGFSYTTVIFYEDEQQRLAAEQSRKSLEESDRFNEPIVTKIIPFTTFYEAEEYHQDFYKKSALRYKSYTDASGRAEFKSKVWEEIQKKQVD